MAGLVMGLLAALALGGCQGAKPYPRTPDEAAMFGPASMRIHPIFTRLRDWDGDSKPDGIEALIEFQDQFNDPTKASGKVLFELYDYRPGWPDPRGQRLANPWIGSLQTLEDQRERWNRTTGTYSFRLAYPQIRDDRTYVLTAIFELAGGGRFFDRMILEPSASPRTTRPSQTSEPQEPKRERAQPSTTRPTTTRASRASRPSRTSRATRAARDASSTTVPVEP